MRQKRSLSDLRAVGSGQSIGSVYFAFGLIGGPAATDIPAQALIRILGELGMRPAAARGALARLRDAGRIEATRRGREVDYRLSPASIAIMTEMARRTMGDAGPAWDGVFHGLLYTIPERERAYRDSMRRAATISGFGQLRPGLLIAPDGSRWERLEPTLAAAPAGSILRRIEISVRREEALDIAVEAWELDRMANVYRAHIARLRLLTERLQRRQPKGRALLRLFASTLEGVYTTIATVPSLPAELLPPDWPAEDLRDALLGFYRAVGIGALAYLRVLVGDLMEVPDPRDRARFPANVEAQT